MDGGGLSEVVGRGSNEGVSVVGRFRRADPALLLAALALGGVGVLAVYAAEADYRQHYAVNQAVGLAVGVTGAAAVALSDYRRLQRHLRPVYGLAIAMLLAVPAAGFAVHGSQSWIDVGPVQVQPSEFAKPLAIVVLPGFAA